MEKIEEKLWRDQSPQKEIMELIEKNSVPADGFMSVLPLMYWSAFVEDLLKKYTLIKK